MRGTSESSCYTDGMRALIFSMGSCAAQVSQSFPIKRKAAVAESVALKAYTFASGGDCHPAK